MKNRIFLDIDLLIRELEPMRGRGAGLVLANGCFDILHVGHVRYLQEASRLGELLVVAVNDDLSARNLKGEGRPVMPQEERAEIICSLRCVDYVLLFGEPTVDGIIRKLKPDIHAKGTDYSVETVPELESAREAGCRTVITGDPKDHSSGEIIRSLRGEE